MAAALAGFGALAGGPLHAAEPLPDSVEALRAEVLKLRQENEALRQAGKPAEAPTAPSEAPAAAPPASTESNPASLETVVVRTRQRSILEELKDVPKSVSIVSGTELAKQDTVNFRDIVTRIGNVSMGYNNPQAASLMIRGVGWASGVGQLDPSVGTNVDGEPYGTGALAASVNFIDLESFDVTRGPQGTLGGKNSSIGQITIKTRQPSFTPEASASITIGQLNTLRTQAVVGGPVIPGLLAWRGSFYREQADGQEKNVNEPKTTFQNRDRTFGRVQFLFTPTADFNARVSLEYTPVMNENGSYLEFPRRTPALYDTLNSLGERVAVDQSLEQPARLSRRWFAQEKNYSIAGDFLGDKINQFNQVPSKYSTKGGSVNLSWDVGGFNLHSTTAFRDYYFDNGISSAGPNTVFDIDRSPTPGHVEYRQISQELKLSSPVGGFVDYQTGIYLFRNHMPDRRTQNSYGGDAGAYYASPAQYARLDADAAGRYLLVNSLDRLYVKTKDDLMNKTQAIYGNLNLHPTEALTLNGGLRLSYEDRSTRSQRLVEDNGFGADLNPASVNNVLLGGASTEDLAQKYFGISAATLATSAYATQRQQLADAKAIRAARIGQLYLNTEAQPFQKVLPTTTLSPIYKFNEEHTGYLTYQHGEKAGVSQIIGANANGGKSVPLKEERTDSYEVGLRSSLLNKTLQVNTGLFYTNISNYIQPMYFEDKAQMLLNGDGKTVYTSGLGNVPRVRTQGLELDATYSGLQYTVFRFAGSYNDARYVDFKTLAKPAELGNDSNAPNYVPSPAYYDASGKTLPGAPKFTFNLNANYERPVLSDKYFHANLNYRYTTSYNNDPSLSRYAESGAYGIADLAIGLGTRDKFFDTTFLVKNLLNTDYSYFTTWNIYVPSAPRWVGVMFSTKM